MLISNSVDDTVVEEEERLDNKIAKLKLLTFAESTKKSYGTHLKRYTDFYQKMGYTAVPASPEVIDRLCGTPIRGPLVFFCSKILKHYQTSPQRGRPLEHSSQEFIFGLLIERNQALT